MPFPREGLLASFLPPLRSGQASSKEPFDDSVRQLLPTVAEPSWFAPPIDVRRDDDGTITLVCQVGGHATAELRVEASGRNVYIWGPRVRRRNHDVAGHRAMRVFALPFDVLPHDVHTSRAGDLLRVRITKQLARPSLPTAPPARVAFAEPATAA